MLHTYGVCAGGDGGSVRGVKAASCEVGEDGPRLRDGEEEAADGGREGEEICSTKPVLVGADPGNGYR